MKKLIAALTAVLLPFLLTGCELVRTVNLQNRAIVQGVGIDWENGEYVVTMQIFSPEGSGGQTIVDPSKENAQVITCRGASVAEAVEKSALSQGKEFYLGHNRILVLGQSVTDQPLQGLLSYFINSLDSRPDIGMLATPGKAADILNAGISQAILPAMGIENTIRNAEQSGLSQEVFLIDVLEELAQPHRSTVIPYIALSQVEDDKKSLHAIQLEGFGIFGSDEYRGRLQGDPVRGLLFLRDSMHNAVYTLQNEEYARAALQLYQSGTRIVPEYTDGKLVFTAEIESHWTLVEKAMNPDRAFTADTLTRLETLLEETVAAECREAFRILVTDYASDAFYLGDLVWKEQPELWEQLRVDWPAGIQNSELVCRVEARIDRTGLENVG